MPTAQTQIVEGTSTIDAVPFEINLGFIPTSFHFWNRSKFASGTTNQIVEGEWNQNLPDGYLYAYNTDASDAITPELMTTGGVTPYNGGEGPLLAAAKTGTNIVKGATTTFTATSHGYSTGDIVIISNVTNTADNNYMRQVTGIFWEIKVSDANTFTIALDSSGANFTSNNGAGAAFEVRRLVVPVEFIPQRLVVFDIQSSGSSSVVSTSFPHGYAVGMKVRLKVPSNFGMTQMDGLEGKITAVSSDADGPTGSINIFTVDIDSSAFTAFAWPASATPFKSNYAQAIPIGAGPTGSPAQSLLDDQVRNQAFQGVILGSGDATMIMPVATDVIDWRAIRADSNS